MNNKSVIVNKLLDMKGKTFQYASQKHFIKDVKDDPDNEKCVIETNLNIYTRNYESLPEFLKYWRPILEVDPSIGSSAGGNSSELDVFVAAQTTQADSLIEILKDNIKKVQADPNYIKQAQTINNNVNSIINVVKMKIDFAKKFKSR